MPIIDEPTAKVILQEVAMTMQIIKALQSTEDAQAIREGFCILAEELKPILQDMNRFGVQLDIDAIKQMGAAGIEREHAVALRIRHQAGKKAFFDAALQGAKKLKANKANS